MNTKLLTGLVVVIIIVGGLLYFRVSEAPAQPEEAAQETASDEAPQEVSYIGFAGAPAVVVAEVQETIAKDNATERRISPLLYTQEVRLTSYEKVTWDNDCLADAPSPEASCNPGTFVGYIVRLNVDGDLQEWRFTEDRSLGSIGAGLKPEFF